MKMSSLSGIEEPTAYQNSRPLDVHRWSDYPEVNEAVKQILEEFKATGAGGTSPRSSWDKLKKHLKVLVIDLYHNHLNNPDGYIGYSRNRNSYTVAGRYDKLHINYRPLMHGIDGLAELGYVEGQRGFHDRRSGIGYQSRMRATQKLIQILTRCHVTEEMIGRAPNLELIILKDQDSKPLDYDETPETVRMRENLKAYNDLLDNHSISLNVETQEKVDLTANRLHRVFNNGSFEDGGRFYGGWWENIKGKYRHYITIDNKDTVELDYTGLHVRLLYAMEGIDYTEDPYNIGDPDRRHIFKKALLTALNTKTRDTAIRAIRSELKEEPLGDLPQLLDNFLEKHKPIAKHFYSGIGIKLQHHDSMIAEEVMMNLTKLGIVVLPVHDSFICAKEHEQVLHDSMTEAYRKFNGPCEVLIERK